MFVLAERTNTARFVTVRRTDEAATFSRTRVLSDKTGKETARRSTTAAIERPQCIMIAGPNGAGENLLLARVGRPSAWGVAHR